MSMLPSQDEQGSRESRRSTNRRRAALACNICRERKVRCDGKKPICTPCQARNYDLTSCVYHVINSSEKARQERAYVQSLQNRIHHLEKQVEQPGSQAQQTIDAGPSASQSSHRAKYTDLLKLGDSSIEIDPAHPADTRLFGEGSGTHDGRITAMGTAVPALMVANSPDESDKYYGQLSVISLTQEITQSTPMGEQNRLANFTAAAKRQPIRPSRTLDSSLLLRGHFALPPKEACDALLQIYWDRVHIFYPWVHVESFMGRYNLLWSSNDETDAKDLTDIGLGGCNCPTPIFYCALNAVFAVACEFSDIPPQDKTASSTTFYERMRTLLQIDILDSGSLCHVQTLLLVAQYLQCTQLPTRCWNVVGMAYRMSVGLGLHCKAASDSTNALEREMRRRIWHACLQMDLIVSMTMGRPTMAKLNHNVPLPVAIDDEFLSMTETDCRQPDGIVSRNQFSVENLRLASILGQILSTVYSTLENGVESMNIQDILRLDATLDSFELTLHPALKWSASADAKHRPSALFTRQSNVLHARFLHLRLLLHRPGLSYHCLKTKGHQEQGTLQGNHNMSSLCQQTSALTCIQVACELIHSIERATTQDETGAWWYSVFYLVSAGIILVLADSQEDLLAKLDTSILETAWMACIQTLLCMAETVHSSAKEYAVALNVIKGRPLAVQTGQQPLPDLPRLEPSANERLIHTENETDTERSNSLLQPEGSPMATVYDSNIRTSSGMPESIFGPLFQSWDIGPEDVMLPAHLFHDMYGGALLPNIF